jgi:hypothetical protein
LALYKNFVELDAYTKGGRVVFGSHTRQEIAVIDEDARRIQAGYLIRLVGNGWGYHDSFVLRPGV